MVNNTEEYNPEIFCFFSSPQWHWKATQDGFFLEELSNRVRVVPARGKERTVRVEIPSEFVKFYHDVIRPDNAVESHLKAVQHEKRWYFMLTYAEQGKVDEFLDIPLWYWTPSNGPSWLSRRKK